MVMRREVTSTWIRTYKHIYTHMDKYHITEIKVTPFRDTEHDDIKMYIQSTHTNVSVDVAPE